MWCFASIGPQQHCGIKQSDCTWQTAESFDKNSEGERVDICVSSPSYYARWATRKWRWSCIADNKQQFGMEKEGLIAPQAMLGVVQTAEGLPLHHEVFEAKNDRGHLTQIQSRKNV
ncbi:MAG: hypothetical protein ACI802_000515 [Candidatus Paceibacteria bacterium]|jgi:hypothetical protein